MMRKIIQQRRLVCIVALAAVLLAVLPARPAQAEDAGGDLLKFPVKVSVNAEGSQSPKAVPYC